MPPSHLFGEEPTTTREAIMGATYRALCEHGYADLTVERIGREFDKSPSLLYHHYEGKDALLLDFLQFLLDRFEATVPDEVGDAYASLRTLLDHLLPETLDAERAEFTRAMVELRAQAAHDPAYREQFGRSDRFVRDRLADILRAGVEQGVFRSLDPERTAAFLLSALHGARVGRATSADEAAVGAVRRELDAYIEGRLLAGNGRPLSEGGQ